MKGCRPNPLQSFCELTTSKASNFVGWQTELTKTDNGVNRIVLLIFTMKYPKLMSNMNVYHQIHHCRDFLDGRWEEITLIDGWKKLFLLFKIIRKSAEKLSGALGNFLC